MLHISVCDDESITADAMKQIIEEEMARQNVRYTIALFSNGDEFLKQYQVRSDELMVVDIDMPVKSGIDVIRDLEKYGKNKSIILVTSYDYLVLKSLSYRPFQIIRKCNMQTEIPEALRSYLREKERNERVIEFVAKGRLYHLEKEKIEYIEKYKHQLTVHVTGGEEFSIRGSLQDYEAQLSHYGFLRIHTGYIVNLQHCYSISKYEMILYSGVKLPISRDKLKMVKEQFMISRRN